MVKNSCKNDPPFLGSNDINLLGFFILSQKSVFGSRLHRVCVEWCGTSTDAPYAFFSCFCCVGVFGNLSDPTGTPVVPTLRGASVDVMTAYAH